MNNCFGKLLKQRREDARAQVIRSLLKTQLFQEIKETVTVGCTTTDELKIGLNDLNYFISGTVAISSLKSREK